MALDIVLSILALPNSQYPSKTWGFKEHQIPVNRMSLLQLEGLHVFVTGAAGGIGSAIVTEFLGNQLPESKRRTALI
jgi:hypothetical protein